MISKISSSEISLSAKSPDYEGRGFLFAVMHAAIIMMIPEKAAMHAKRNESFTRFFSKNRRVRGRCLWAMPEGINSLWTLHDWVQDALSISFRILKKQKNLFSKKNTCILRRFVI